MQTGGRGFCDLTLDPGKFKCDNTRATEHGSESPRAPRSEVPKGDFCFCFFTSQVLKRFEEKTSSTQYGALPPQFVGGLFPALHWFGAELRVRPVRRGEPGPRLRVRGRTGDHGSGRRRVGPGELPEEMLRKPRVRRGHGGVSDGRGAPVHADQLPHQRPGRVRVSAERAVQGLPQEGHRGEPR